jgi:hypothetical protein
LGEIGFLRHRVKLISISSGHCPKVLFFSFHSFCFKNLSLSRGLFIADDFSGPDLSSCINECNPSYGFVLLHHFYQERDAAESQKVASYQPLDERLETISQTVPRRNSANCLCAIQSHLNSKSRSHRSCPAQNGWNSFSRRELQQYQQHFHELYEQMALLFTETRQYYNTFNSSGWVAHTCWAR